MEAVNKLCNIETLLYPRCLEQSAYKKLACVTQYVCFVGNRMLLGLERERECLLGRERDILCLFWVWARERFLLHTKRWNEDKSLSEATKTVQPWSPFSRNRCSLVPASIVKCVLYLPTRTGIKGPVWPERSITLVHLGDLISLGTLLPN